METAGMSGKGMNLRWVWFCPCRFRNSSRDLKVADLRKLVVDGEAHLNRINKCERKKDELPPQPNSMNSNAVKSLHVVSLEGRLDTGTVKFMCSGFIVFCKANYHYIGEW